MWWIEYDHHKYDLLIVLAVENSIHSIYRGKGKTVKKGEVFIKGVLLAAALEYTGPVHLLF